MKQKSNKELIQELLNGGEQYSIVLESIRKIIKQKYNKDSNESKYGAVAFFKYDKKSSKKVMNFFPLFPEIIDTNFPKDDDIIIKYLSLINQDRSIDNTFYKEHFRKNYNKQEHFILSLETDDYLIHSNETIGGMSWEEYIVQQNLDIKKLDLLFFNNDYFTFSLIPVAVFSTPCILIFLPYNANLSISNLMIELSESINSYVINRLMIEITKDVKLDDNNLNTPEHFVERFIEEFNQVALPIKYTVDDELRNFVDWHDNFCIDNVAEIELNLNNKFYKFYLPTFCNTKNVLIHKTERRKIKFNEFKYTIENIFKLVYENWKAVKSADERAKETFNQILLESGLTSSITQRLISAIELANNQNNKDKIDDEYYTKLITIYDSTGKTDEVKQCEIYCITNVLKMINIKHSDFKSSKNITEDYYIVVTTKYAYIVTNAKIKDVTKQLIDKNWDSSLKKGINQFYNSNLSRPNEVLSYNDFNDQNTPIKFKILQK